MTLRRSNVSIIADITNPEWTTQVQYYASALLLATRQLSGVPVEVKGVGVKAADKGGKNSLVRFLVQVPTSNDKDQEFLDGSDVAVALVSSALKTSFDIFVKQLSGFPSTAFFIEASQNEAIIVQAPGLVLGVATGGDVLLNLTLENASEFEEVYGISPAADLADAAVGSINYTATPLIASDPRGTVITSNELIRSAVLTDPLAGGTWKYTATEVVADTGDTVSATFVSTVNNADNSIVMTKDGGGIGADGRPNSLPVISHKATFNVGLTSLFALRNAVSDGLVAVPAEEYTEAATAFRKFTSLDRIIEVTNNTGSTVASGTKIGELHVQKSISVEIF